MDPVIPTDAPNSPMKATAAGVIPHRHLKLPAGKVHLILEKEMNGSAAGFYPVQDFLDKYLPLPDNMSRVDIPSIDFSLVPINGRESLMYDPLVNAINNSDAFPGFVMKNTNNVCQYNSKSRPDLGGYRDEETNVLIPEIPWEIKTSLGDICCPEDSDPRSSKLEKNTGDARSIRGQIFNYLAQGMSACPRLFIFMVFIFGDRARLIYADRSGGIITASFLYKEVDFLAQFLLRYSKMTDAQRGWDPTAARASPQEAADLTRSVHECKARLSNRNMDHLNPTLDEQLPTYKIKIDAKTVKDENIDFHLIIRFPFSDCKSLIGRCTRGYAAYHVEEKRLVFLKDCWRVDDDTTLSEIEIYKILFAVESNVMNLPDVIAMGDVIVDGELQATHTQDVTNRVPRYAWLVSRDNPNEPRSSLRLQRLIHMRIVEELSIPLDSALNSREVVEAIYDGVVCVSGAYKIKVYHRDISVKNVMIRDLTNPAISKYTAARSIGILNDWDHAIVFPRTSAHDYRTGTWAFMSIKHLKNPFLPHEIHDDLESFLWVLTYIALHRFKEAGPPIFDLRLFNELNYTPFLGHPHLPTGGQLKSSIIQDDSLSDIEFISSAVKTLLLELMEEFSDYSPYICSSRSRPLTTRKQRRFANAYARLGNPEVILSIIRKALEDPGWDLEDWAKVDKYPPKFATTGWTDAAKYDSTILTGTGTGQQPSGSGRLQSSLELHRRMIPLPKRATSSGQQDSHHMAYNVSSQSLSRSISGQQTPDSSGGSSPLKRSLDTEQWDWTYTSTKKMKTKRPSLHLNTSQLPSRYAPAIPKGNLTDERRSAAPASLSQGTWPNDKDEDRQSSGSPYTWESTPESPPLSSPAGSLSSFGPEEEPDPLASDFQPEDVVREESDDDLESWYTRSRFTRSSRTRGSSSSSHPPERTGFEKDWKGKGKARDFEDLSD